ncbi:MAG: outer membrane lipid asymmetry maintenance protein MlaD [Janthinobacterium lividum]
MRKNVIEAVMGTVVLVIAGFFLTFAYTNSGYQTKNSRVSYFAKFDRVDGVVIGGDVRMSGVKIGTIREMTLEPKTFLAELRFEVDKDLRIPDDSSAEIVSDGIMGGKYLAIVPGGDDTNFLKPGDHIENTQSSVSIEGMIGQLIFNAKDKKKEEAEAEVAKEPKHS